MAEKHQDDPAALLFAKYRHSRLSSLSGREVGAGWPFVASGKLQDEPV
jgi:hypothetical protein